MKYLPLYFLCFLTSCSKESWLPAAITGPEIVGEYTGKTVKRFPYKISAFKRIENRDSKSKITITALYGSKPTIESGGEYLIYGKLEWTPGSKEHLCFGAAGYDYEILGLEMFFHPKQAVSYFTLGTEPGPNSPLYIGTFTKPDNDRKYIIWLTNEDEGQGEGTDQGKGLPQGEGAKSLSDLKSRLTGKK